ncbi:hypothetical protein VNI00_000666 [Paramarasmius palmivorus]|uniref:Uncharacterized protein n=1 Tax=Paramarasmius palmivorus TaxID=297713 RepID=A0AAW0E6K5_9AGAR
MTSPIVLDGSAKTADQHFRDTIEKILKRKFGWEELRKSDGSPHLKFWKKCWGKQKLKEVTQHPELVPADALKDSSSKPMSFPILHKKRALLREEYKTLYAWLENSYNEGKYGRQATMINGHPGIGKSTFRMYILYCRCAERKPTLYHEPEDYELYLFYDGGVLRVKQQFHFDSLILQSFKSATWLLLDEPQEKNVEIPPTLAKPIRSFPRIILTASPWYGRSFRDWGGQQLDRDTVYSGPPKVLIPLVTRVREWYPKERSWWCRMSKGIRTFGGPEYMHGWTDAELQQGCYLHYTSWSDVLHRIKKVGRVPRHLETHDDILDEFNLCVIETIVIDGGTINQINKASPEGPHSLLFEDSGDSDSDDKEVCRKSTFLSRYVIRELRTQIALHKYRNQAKIIKLFSGIPKAASMVGNLYELDVLSQLLAAASVRPLPAKIYRMSCRPIVRQKRKMASIQACRDPARQYYTAYGLPSSDPALQQERDMALRESATWKFPLLEVVTYKRKSSAKIRVQTGKLYVPRSQNKHGLDAFYVKGDKLYLLQIVIAASHDVKPAIRRIGKYFTSLPQQAKWTIIFIQPRERTMTVTYPRKVDGIPLFHLCLPPGPKTGLEKEEGIGEIDDDL